MFSHYMTSSRHIILYRLTSSFPPLVRMNQVETLCLIHCHPDSISRIIQPTLFPSLRQIHYLSSAPTNNIIHRQFHRKVSWVFPNLDVTYPFYDHMFEGGFARKETGMISQYLVREKQLAGTSWFDLYVPGMGIVRGEDYLAHQALWFGEKQRDLAEEMDLAEEIDPVQEKGSPFLINEQAILDARWIREQPNLEGAFCRVVLGL